MQTVIIVKNCSKGIRYMNFDEKDIKFFDNFEKGYYTKIKQEYLSLKENNKTDELIEFTNPNRMYFRLGVDILGVQVSQNISPVADPYLLYEMQVLRQSLTDWFGYIIPPIRVMDNSTINNYEFIIIVRGYVVYRGHISEEDLKQNNPREIIKSLYKVCFDYVHYIMTRIDTLKLMELIKSQDPTLVDDIIPKYITTCDLKHICANLIQRKVGIKDITLVFELLNEHARYTQDINELTDILEKELSFAP